MVAEPDDIAHFAYPKRPIGGRRQLRITYRAVNVSFDWPDTDQGLDDLDRLIGALEELMKSARGEMDISNSMRNLDDEIQKLLGGDEE